MYIYTSVLKGGYTSSIPISFHHLSFTAISTLPSSPQQLLNIRERDPLVLSCTRPDSLPEATVTWYDGSSPIEFSDGRLGVTLEGSLVFSTFQGLTDSGSFSCEVSNDVISSSAMTSSRYLLQAGTCDSFS